MQHVVLLRRAGIHISGSALAWAPALQRTASRGATRCAASGAREGRSPPVPVGAGINGAGFRGGPVFRNRADQAGRAGERAEFFQENRLREVETLRVADLGG